MRDPRQDKRSTRIAAKTAWTRILVRCWTRESGENPEHVETEYRNKRRFP